MPITELQDRTIIVVVSRVQSQRRVPTPNLGMLGKLETSEHARRQIICYGALRAYIPTPPSVPRLIRVAVVRRRQRTRTGKTTASSSLNRQRAQSRASEYSLMAISIAVRIPPFVQLVTSVPHRIEHLPDEQPAPQLNPKKKVFETIQPGTPSCSALFLV